MYQVSGIRYQVLALILCAIVLGSCAPDPRKEAAAFAERTDAEQRAADAEQARLIADERAALALEQQRETNAARIRTINAVIEFATPFAQATAAMLVLALGAAGVWTIYSSARAWALYAQRRAETLGDVIKLDPQTHTYPVRLIRVGGNVVALMNPNDNSVIMFDQHNPADAAKVQALANVLWAGEMGRHARLSHKPGEVATITAPVVIDSEVK